MSSVSVCPNYSFTKRTCWLLYIVVKNSRKQNTGREAVRKHKKKMNKRWRGNSWRRTEGGVLPPPEGGWSNHTFVSKGRNTWRQRKNLSSQLKKTYRFAGKTKTTNKKSLHHENDFGSVGGQRSNWKDVAIGKHGQFYIQHMTYDIATQRKHDKLRRNMRPPFSVHRRTSQKVQCKAEVQQNRWINTSPPPLCNSSASHKERVMTQLRQYLALPSLTPIGLYRGGGNVTHSIPTNEKTPPFRYAMAGVLLISVKNDYYNTLECAKKTITSICGETQTERKLYR